MMCQGTEYLGSDWAVFTHSTNSAQMWAVFI
jgi:hypothetical protein